MKKITLMSLCMGLVLSGISHAQQWQQLTGLGSDTRHHPVTWAIDGVGYAVTGSTYANQNGSDDFLKYTPATDSWEQLDDFPGTARSFSIGAVYNDKGYIGFGSSTTSYLNDLWVFNPAAEEGQQWEELTSCPCSGRQHPTFTINEQYGKLYIGQGNNASGNLKDWWEYDIATDSWTQMPDFPGTERHHPYHFSIGQYSYAGLGHDNSPAMAREDLYRFDPSDNSWQQMTDAPGGRIAGTQFAYGGYGFVLDGDGSSHSSTNPSIFWKYDPAANTWEELIPHAGESLWAPGSFIINGTLYFFGGMYRSNSTLFSDMWATDLDILLSVPNFEGQNISIYPNPAREILHISSTGDLENINFEIYSLGGQLLMKNITREQVNISSLASGMYIVKLIGDSGDIQHIRFIKR